MLAEILFASDADSEELLGGSRPHDDALAERDRRDAQRDQRWVELLAGADVLLASDALSAILDAYFDRLVRFAYGLVGSADLAEDIVQDTLVRVWETRHTVRTDTSFRSFLFTAVRRRALNALKHAAVEGRYVADVRAGTREPARPIELSIEETLDAVTVGRAIRAAIAQLPERRQTAIRLRYEEELPFAAVAEIMGISEKAAKDLVARTIREIRGQLHRQLPSR